MNKEDIKRSIFALLMLSSLIILSNIVNHIEDKEKTYEYALNCEMGVSSNCYLKNDIGYCEKDNIMIKVDNFYEMED